MRSGVLCAFITSCLFFWTGVPTSASAFDFKTEQGIRLHVFGQDRFHYRWMQDFPLDESGKLMKSGQSGVYFHQLRLGVSMLSGKWKVAAETDLTLFDDLFGAGTPGESFTSSLKEQASGLRLFAPRQLYLQWISPIGLLKTGLMTSRWGLGLVANDGGKPTGEFASPRFGDVVLRTGIMTPILRLFSRSPITRQFVFSAFFDVVFRDENARLMSGDFAYQGVFALFFRDKKKLFAGIYTAIRRQQDAAGTRIRAWVVDVFYRASHVLIEKNMLLDFAFEGVYLLGSSDRILNDAGRDGVELIGMAGVFRSGVRLPKMGLRFGLEVGGASGDNDTSDGTSRSFRMDPDYQPSLILFRQVLSQISGRSADRAADPGRVGTPARGTDQIPTYGRVTNVLYLQPVIAFRPVLVHSALRRLELKLGLLWARSLSDLVDPYNSFREGGVNHTHLHVRSEGRNDLGYEFNVSLSYGHRIWRTVDVHASVVYGHFFPGQAFVGAGGKKTPIDLLQIRTRFRF